MDIVLEALQRVRERIKSDKHVYSDGYGYVIPLFDALAIVDDEIAKLGGQVPQENAPALRLVAAGDCCMNCYNSHGDCVDHGNCECHTGRRSGR